MSRPLIAVIGQRCTSVPILRYSATLAAEAICEAVYAGGGEPAIIHGPAADPSAGLAERLARFDGVLMPGGADIDPARYGEEATADEVYGVVAFQDTFDLAVAQVVLAAELPTLAICRGMQVVNVALGGTLAQHLPASSVEHWNTQHPVSVDQGSRLFNAVGAESVNVSSYHHQGLDRLGQGLVVVGRAADGVVEAVELAGVDMVAVQWHPEDLHASSSTDAALFSDLVERADAGRSRRAEAAERSLA